MKRKGVMGVFVSLLVFTGILFCCSPFPHMPFSVLEARADDTGFLSPSQTGDPNNQWINPTNAYSSNDAYATENTNNQKQDWHSFGFGVPGGAAIDGIEVRIEAQDNYCNDAEGAIVELSWDGGTNYTFTGRSFIGGCETDTISTLGGASDTWGRTWRGDELSNANFRIRLSKNGLDGDPAWVDHIQVKVYYTPSDIVIDCDFSDWCDGDGTEFCVDDEAGQDDWSSPAKLDITRFAVESDLSDTFHILFGFDDVPPQSTKAATLIDTDLDGKINFALVAILDGADSTVELYSCDDTMDDGCSGAVLETYSGNFCAGSAAGPWNDDSFLEATLPYSDLGFAGGNIVLTNLISYADAAFLTSPKDAVLGANGQNYDGRILYNTDDGTGDILPTAVTLVSFMATRHGNGVLLCWQTGYEVDNLGFHVYREQGGKRIRLTPKLVAGSALLAGAGVPLTAGRSYAWVDVVSDEGGLVQYWLEDVDLNGQRTWHGPVTPELSSEPMPPRFHAVALSELGIDHADRKRALEKIEVLRAKLAKAPPSGPSRLGKGAKGISMWQERLAELGEVSAARWRQRSQGQAAERLERQWELASEATVKLWVEEEGWYRVGQPELVAVGLDPGVNPRNLQLWVDGEEWPVFVRGERDGRFDEKDAIEFYGVGRDTPFTDTRIYWLVVGDRPGKRIKVLRSRGRAKAVSQSFLCTVEKRDRTLYFAALKNGDEENFFGPVVWTEPLDQLMNVPHPDPSHVGEALLEVVLQGVSMELHQVKVLLNDVEVAQVVFEGQARGVARVPILQAGLLHGDNLVTLVAQGGETDVSLVDTIRLTYWRTYTADEDALRFTGQGGEQLSISGFSTREIQVVDITDAGNVLKLPGKAKGNNRSGFTLEVEVPGTGERTLLAFSKGRVKEPVNVALDEPSAWHGGSRRADLVIIAHGDFIEGIKPLVELREAQGWSVALIHVEDLYDEFGFGSKSPQVLRDFLSHARSRWDGPPRFVLLVGDASFDPRNYMGLGDYDLVPTKLMDTVYLETASDDWFSDFDGDGVPEMSVGRLPVRTADEAAVVVAKLLAYEQAVQKREVLLVADQDEVFNFEAASLQLEALLPEEMDAQEIFRGQLGTQAAREALLDGFNGGPLLVNYAGHGSVELWRGKLLTSDDAGALTNGPHLPFVVAMTCLNGMFHDLYTESLAEALLKVQQGGAVAVWASSGLTFPSGQAVMNRELFRLLFHEQELTLGEATKWAKWAIQDQDIRRTWILFGDPTIRLK